MAGRRSDPDTYVVVYNRTIARGAAAAMLPVAKNVSR
ncbi:MAG: hypothetical protein JWP38_3122 [Herbaspirillum sp.]|jgi:hypothetical protein|nr:hypothetical protein [Herbaspirillum sp.]